MTDPWRNLWSPTAAAIPRIADAVSFLYLDRLQVTQDDTGVCARKYRKGRPPETMYLPVAQIATILLGPGTTVTTRAMSTMQRNGCTVVWVGDGGVRAYASATPETAPTTWLEHQARAWADPAMRTAVVKRMFAYRFGGSVDLAGKTIEQMRGMEGARMKQLYHSLGKEHGIKAFKRSYDPADWDRQDPVNKALSSANLCLYGIVRAAIAAMGCSPSLGFLHTGKTGAFAYDIADLYKAELTIPLAFSLHGSSDPERHARQSFRTDLNLFKLMPRIVGDIKHVLTGEHAPDRDQADGAIMLWDGENGPVASGVNYAD